MSRLKTLEEIASQPLMSKADIRKLMHCGAAKAKEIFDLADIIDRAELRYRVFDYKVRTSSVCRVIGLTEEELKKGALAMHPRQ